MRLQLQAKTYDERLEMKFMVSAWIIKKLESEIGREETVQFLKAINERPLLSVPYLPLLFITSEYF